MDINSRILQILEASPFRAYPQVQGGDPNRGAAGRAVPALPRGVDPYGSGLPSRGKLAARLSGLSDEGRKRYYREIGMRSRVASRGGVTGRLYATEGSRGRARHERIVKALEKKSAALFGATRGLKPHQPEYAKAAAGKAKRSVSEGAVKDALADYLYSIPKEAIEELRPVMKIKSLNKRFAMITKVLKKHGFTQQFMGSMPTNVVNDYYDTFFG